MEVFSAYIPIDRRCALAQNVPLPDRSEGTALFADISGFTPLTEALASALGPRRGAEELTVHLNSVYQALIQEVDRYLGSVTAFAGDAITCWFDGDNGRRAMTCAHAMQTAMAQFAKVQLATGQTTALAVKIGIARGPTRRFLAGDPKIQILDILAGRTLARMAEAAHLASRGEIIVAPEIVASLGAGLQVTAWRKDPDSNEMFAVAGSCSEWAASESWPMLPELGEATARSWLITPVYERLHAGQGEFLTELRPATAIFVRFDGIDYDEDKDAGPKLSQYVSWVQGIMTRYEGFLVTVAVGDKGSYLCGCFGAPIAHENDPWRAINAASEISKPPPELRCIQGTHIGISGGTMLTGAYGATTRRTYGFLGDAVNLAARLMEHAAAGQVLVSERVTRAAGPSFSWQALPPLKVKGKAEPTSVLALTGVSQKVPAHIVEAQYALELVGRTTELAKIEEGLARVARGQGQILCLTAEAGMGKSRLVAETIRLAGKYGLKIHMGQCQAHGAHTSYLAWHEVWQGLFGVDSAQPVSAQIAILQERLSQISPTLTARLPLLGTALSIPIPDNDVTAPMEARLRKSSLESLLVECLRAIAKDSPLLLIVEDTHWIDALSYDLLDVLARSISRVPVLVLFTQRPREKGYSEVHGFEHLPYFAELQLNAFTDNEAGRLIQLKLAQLFDFSGPTPPMLAGRLVARSTGNPFYLEELLNFLKDEKIDFEDAEAVKNLELPTSLHSLVLSRIDRLSQTQQGALKIASVVGRLFQAAVIWGVQPEVDRRQISADLIRLCEVDLTAVDRPEPELIYIFKHIVTQEVAYESLPHATRARLHNEIGLCLEQVLAGRLEQNIDLLAFHFDRSTNLPKKRLYLQLAGRAAQANYANAAAISYYERVLPLLDAAERIEILLNLGKVRELTGEWRQAGACYQKAFESAEGTGDRAAKARCQAAMGDLLRKQGLFAEATDWLGLARTGFEEIGDQGGVGQTLHAMGTVGAMQGNYEQARLFYEESLAIRRQLMDQSQIASLLSNLGIIARFSAQYDKARDLMEESLAIRRQVGDRWAVANSLNNLGVLLRDLGDLARARSLLEESLALNRQVGDVWANANTLSSLAEVTIDQKDWPATEAFLVESLKINQDLGDRTAVAFILECFASMAAGQGDAARALCLAGAASNLRAAIGSPLSPSEQQRLDKSLQPVRDRISLTEARSLHQQGGRLSLEEAIAMATGAR